MPMKPPSPCRSPRCPNRGPGYSPTCQGLVANQLLGPIHGRGVWLFGKWRDVVDQVRAFSAHGPDVPALGTAVVVSARQFARGRQKPARRTVTRWTVRDRGHGWGTTHYPSEMAVRAIRESPYRNQCLCSKRSETPPLLAKDPAPMIRADTTAPVFNDEEKRARATTQAHKAARDGYRFDVGTFAIWAGCDRATTLVAGARHVGVLRLLLARGLNRLRRKWRDVVDQLRVVLVHAPDVSARTAIVPDSRVLARERQIVGGVLPTRRTGRTRHGGKSSFPARNVPAEPQAICATLRAVDSFVRPKSWEAIPFVYQAPHGAYILGEGRLAHHGVPPRRIATDGSGIQTQGV